MDWKAHLLFGCIFGAVGGSSLLSLEGLPLAFFSLTSGVCALLPDLDLRKSKSSQLLYAALALCALAAAYYLSGMATGVKAGTLDDFVLYFLLLALALLVLDFIVRPRHRGVMHGLVFLCACAAAAWFFLGQFFALSFFLGYLSHLLADMCIKP